MTATLENNESCSGKWAVVSQNDPSAGQMAAQWDQVYGQGFFVANVLGNRFLAHATLRCTQGATLSLEFFRIIAENLMGSKGVAQDSKNNLYKVTF